MNSIKHLAGIPRFYAIERIENQGCASVIHISRKPRDRTCPTCGGRGNVHGHEKRSMFCAPIGGMPTAVRIRQRRYRCPMCKRTWLEADELKSPLSSHMTNDLVTLIGVELMRRQSARSISRRFGPSKDMACKVLDAMAVPEPYLPRVLRVDELEADTDAGKTGAYAVDGERGVLVDVLRDRRPETLDAWFSRFSEGELGSVDCLCCDMRWGFVNAAERWLPCAEVRVDRFHVVRCVTKAFDKVRARLQREACISVKQDLKGARKLFLMRKPRLEDLDAKRIESGKEPLACRVEYLLGTSEELAKAYARLQAFYVWADTDFANGREMKKALGDWISQAQNCGIKEIAMAAGSIKEAEEHVLNAYRTGKTNAYAENDNRKIKDMKRRACGFANFENMRRRLLLAFGYPPMSKEGVALPNYN
ncbi:MULTISPECIES: ISL3 family transposase [unclassified Adlercreutzia]|uniref:ISL3 family transposase n=1 Tax=unclassified Adlercreutzia TaxID=2636013 RepID=UPI0013ED67B5|nr:MULTISPECIES: ISL3 family transposase [unclassified Adlercreutzia]